MIHGSSPCGVAIPNHQLPSNPTIQSNPYGHHHSNPGQKENGKKETRKKAQEPQTSQGPKTTKDFEDAHRRQHLVQKKEIDVVLIEHKDRLSRFCFHYLEAFFNSYQVQIEKVEEILSKGNKQELVEDILSLMASFSAKIYGLRSGKNRKKAEKVLAT